MVYLLNTVDCYYLWSGAKFKIILILFVTMIKDSEAFA